MYCVDIFLGWGSFRVVVRLNDEGTRPVYKCNFPWISAESCKPVCILYQETV